MDNPPVLLTPAVIREHLELIIGPKDRAVRSVWFAICDDEGRPVAHMAVDELPPDPSVEDYQATMKPIVMALEHLGGGGQLLAAITRPGHGAIGESERRWFRAVHGMCRPAGIGVLGVYLVTPREIVPIHPDDVL